MSILGEFKIGQRVIVTDGCCDWDASDDYSRKPGAPRETYVLGVYDRGFIQVYKAKEFGGYVCTIDGVHHEGSWSVAPDYLKPLEELKPIKAYPHACSKCKSPARKVGKTILCSNPRCKTRNDFKRRFPNPSTPADVNGKNFVICHTCDSDLLRSLGAADGGMPGHILVTCPKGHTRVHIFKVGHKLGADVYGRSGYYIYTERNTFDAVFPI